jgi:hypothetical protein
MGAYLSFPRGENLVLKSILHLQVVDKLKKLLTNTPAYYFRSFYRFDFGTKNILSTKTNINPSSELIQRWQMGFDHVPTLIPID